LQLLDIVLTCLGMAFNLNVARKYMLNSSLVLTESSYKAYLANDTLFCFSSNINNEYTNVWNTADKTAIELFSNCEEKVKESLCITCFISGDVIKFEATYHEKVYHEKSIKQILENLKFCLNQITAVKMSSVSVTGL
jgi:hypothetical protein